MKGRCLTLRVLVRRFAPLCLRGPVLPAVIAVSAANAPSATLYTLTVSNGLGSGSYPSGAVVTITAAPPSPGQVFDVWQRNARLMANPWEPSTTLTMPATNVATSAAFRTVHSNGWQVFADPGHHGLNLGTFPLLHVDAFHIFTASPTGGVWRASLIDRQFSPLPMTGLPMYSTANPTGLTIVDVASTAQGAVVVSCGVGEVMNTTNTLPLHYWFDATSHVWRAAAYVNKPYPYLHRTARFSKSPDGSLWSASGFAPYVYRSTNGGQTFVAMNLDELTPPGYLPIPSTAISSFGKIFNVAVAPDGAIYAGTETGGYLRSTNGGAAWFALDSNYSDPNTTNSLNRVGNAIGGGFDRSGRALLETHNPSLTNNSLSLWGNVALAGFDPVTQGEFNASFGLPQYLEPGPIVLTANGENFMFTRQNTNNTGGIYRSTNGTHWLQFNLGIPVLNPPIFGTQPADAIAVSGNRVFVGASDGRIWHLDTVVPVPPRLANGSAAGPALTAETGPGETWVLQRSASLTNWLDVGLHAADGAGILAMPLPPANTNGATFFRLRWP